MSVRKAHLARQAAVYAAGLPTFLRRNPTFGKLAANIGAIPQGFGYGGLEAALAIASGQQQQQQSLVAMAGVPSNLTELVALLEIQSQLQQQSVTQAQVITVQAVYQFQSWYDSELIQNWAQQLAPKVDALAHAIASQTDAYIASMVNWANDLKTKPGEFHNRYMRTEGTVETGDKLREGNTTHAGVYGRIADVYRWQQHRHDQHAIKIATDPNPAPPALQSPLDAALARAHDIASTDIQLAVRKQAMHSLRGAERRGLIIGYRRVLHPEFDRTGVCGLCVAASTKIYKTSHLMPLHQDCHCTPFPVVEGHDPGALINDHDLTQLYDLAGGTDRAGLERTHFSIVQHGENGPWLIPTGAAHRTPGMVKKATAPRPRSADSEARKRRQLTTLRDSLARSLQRVDDQLKPDAPDKWTEYRETLADRIASLDRQLKGGSL